MTETGLWFQLGEPDQPLFERGDEWFRFVPDDLVDLKSSELEAIEKAWPDKTLAYVLYQVQRGSQVGVRAGLWLARRQAGIVEDWTAFDPRSLLIGVARTDPSQPAPAKASGKARTAPRSRRSSAKTGSATG